MSERAAAEFVVCENPGSLAGAVADAFVSDAQAAIGARGAFFTALAGGTTPKAAYELLAQEPRRSRVEWERVQIFFGDERCVEPTSHDSNYRMAEQAFLQACVPPANVHRIHGEDDPPQAAADYADLLVTLMGAQPRFDLIMLGMGPDGHTASLFPGIDPRTDEELLVRAVFAERLNAHRVTFTPAVLNAARHVLVAAEGEGKASILKSVRSDKKDPVRYPVQIVAPRTGLLSWYVDRAAWPG